jgi:cell division protease FtsH
MRKAFEQAKRSAPSLLILEEIDAVAPARGSMSHDHKVEEWTEILRMNKWKAAMEALLLVVEQSEPTMFARIGVMRAPAR